MNNNITNNKCDECPSMWSILEECPTFCNFPTFRGNNQTRRFSFHYGCNTFSLTQTISYCNIIGNQDSEVLFFCNHAININHCIFLNNIAKYMFWQYSEDYYIIISNSYVDKNSTSGEGIVTFTDLTNSYNINAFADFHIKKCYTYPKKISIKLLSLSKITIFLSALIF